MIPAHFTLPELPPRWNVTFITPSEGGPDPLPDFPASLHRALAAPTGSPALGALAARARSALLVVPDLTRPCPDGQALPVILDVLEDAGLPPSRVTLLVATGLHRPLTREELDSRFGPVLARGVTARNHDARDPACLTSFGEIDSVPVQVNRALVSHDLLLTTGIVEPHQFAGFSGGVKTVAIGAAGEATIAASHAPRFLSRPGVRLGVTHGNPFQTLVKEIGKRIGLSFCVNVLLDQDSRVVDLAAGHPEPVHAELARKARALYLRPLSESFDLAIANVPPPKDQNVYQASRAATYLQLGGEPLVREGGALFVIARCPEGAGQGVGEQRFFTALSQSPGPREYLERVLGQDSRGGEQRSYFLAQVLSKTKVAFVGTRCPDVVQKLHMIPAETIRQAIERADLDVDAPLKVLVVADPFRTLPIKESSP